MGRANGATCTTCVGAAAAGILFRLFDLLPPDPLPARHLSPVCAVPPPPPLVRVGTAPAPIGGDAPRITFPVADTRLLVDSASPQVRLAVDATWRPQSDPGYP